eukprot:6192983-Pleurochrysis_carterae.AAC.1
MYLSYCLRIVLHGVMNLVGGMLCPRRQLPKLGNEPDPEQPPEMLLLKPMLQKYDPSMLDMAWCPAPSAPKISNASPREDRVGTVSNCVNSAAWQARRAPRASAVHEQRSAEPA